MPGEPQCSTSLEAMASSFIDTDPKTLTAAKDVIRQLRDERGRRDELLRAEYERKLSNKEETHKEEIDKLTADHKKEIDRYSARLTNLTHEKARLDRLNFGISSTVGDEAATRSEMERQQGDSAAMIKKLQDEVKRVSEKSAKDLSDMQGKLQTEFAASITMKDAAIKQKDKQIAGLDINLSKTQCELSKYEEKSKSAESKCGELEAKVAKLEDEIGQKVEAEKAKWEKIVDETVTENESLITERDAWVTKVEKERDGLKASLVILREDFDKEKRERATDTHTLGLELAEVGNKLLAANVAKTELEQRLDREREEWSVEKGKLKTELEDERRSLRDENDLLEKRHAEKLVGEQQQQDLDKSWIRDQARKAREDLMERQREEIEKRDSEAKKAIDDLMNQLAEKDEAMNSMKLAFEKEREQFEKDLAEEKKTAESCVKAVMGDLDQRAGVVVNAIVRMNERLEEKNKSLHESLDAKVAVVRRDYETRLAGMIQDHKNDSNEKEQTLRLQAVRHSETVTKLSEEINANEKAMSEMKTTIESLTKDLQECRVQRDSLVADRDDEIRQLRRRILVLETQVKADGDIAKAEKKRLLDTIADLETKLRVEENNYRGAFADVTHAVKTINTTKQDLQNDAVTFKDQMVRDHERLVGAMQVTISNLKEQLAQARQQHDKIVSDMCKKHGEYVTTTERERLSKDERIANLTEELRALKEEYEATKQNHILEETASRNELENQIASLREEVNTLTGEKVAADERLRNSEDLNTNLKERVSFFDQVIKTNNERLGQLANEHATEREVTRQEHSRLGNLIKSTDSPERMFKDLMERVDLAWQNCSEVTPYGRVKRDDARKLVDAAFKRLLVIQEKATPKASCSVDADVPNPSEPPRKGTRRGAAALHSLAETDESESDEEVDAPSPGTAKKIRYN